jgi:predicted acetyltransferase
MTQEKIFLREIDFKDHDIIQDLKQEILATDNKTNGLGHLLDYDNIYDWLDYRIKIKDKNFCPVGLTQSISYLALRESDNYLIGMCDLRFDPKIIGHIGYYVRASQRRKGYATQILDQAIYQARAHKINPIIIFCLRENLASQRVIFNNHGSLIQETLNPEGKARFIFELI